MVISVTRRGSNGRAHLVGGRHSPRSHVLNKAVGATIAASWIVTNTGGTPTQGFLEILFTTPTSGFLGPTVNIPAGATVTLSVSGVIDLVRGKYIAQLRIRAATPATVGAGGDHRFNLTIR